MEVTATAVLQFEGLVVIAAIAALAVGYGRGLESAGPRVPPQRAAALYAGLVAIGVALVGPLEQAAHTSFSAHMAQHLLLGVVAPPLLLAGRLPQVMSRAGGRGLRVRTGRWYGAVRRLVRGRAWLPVSALAAYTLVWWGWHIPAAYTAALESAPLHVAEHATMLAAGLALWAPVLHPRATPRWLSPLLLFGATIQGGLLAALLTFSPAPWYPALTAGAGDAAVARALTDQQAGGALMWVVAGLVFVVAGAVSLARALREDEVAAGRLGNAGALRAG